MTLHVIPIVLLVGAVVTFLVGPQGVANWLVLASLVSLLVIDLVRLRWRKPTPPPELSPDQEAALRAEREAKGEVAAVRLLRKEHPGTSLVDAVQLVRNL